MNTLRSVILIISAGAGIPLLLGACAGNTPPARVAAAAPAQWYAPGPSAHLPHNGTVTDLSQWWQQHGDALLVQLIEAAQAVSPTLASAKSRIEQARATNVTAGAALLPTLDASASATRSSAQSGLPLTNTRQSGLQAAWEIDLFGANRASRSASQARLDGAQAGWHDARVSVAAEVANQYYGFRSCEKFLATTRADTASRAETARLTRLSAAAGFQAPAQAALASASAAEGNSRTIQQQALCDLDIKALVALTAIAEPQLRLALAENRGRTPGTLNFSIASVPAQLMTQRPDVFMAESEVAAASAEVGSAQAQRYPRLSLSGSIGTSSVRSSGVTTNFDTWSIGPVSLTLPIFDGGKRAANVDAAQARYEEAAVKYRSTVRQAVREVEQALVTLQSTVDRSNDTQAAVDGYRASFNATQTRYSSGLASLVELEDARRTLLNAQFTLLTLQRERIVAWVSLYRAVGGGWNAAKNMTQQP